MVINDNNINIPIQIRKEIDSYMRKFVAAGESTPDDLVRIIALLEGASPDVKNNTLHYAVKDGSPELINAIIRSGADVNSIIEEKTPMMAAIIDIDIDAPDYLWQRIEQQKNIIEALLDNGANPSEIVGGQTMADVINSKINRLVLEGDGNRNIEIDFQGLIQTLEEIKEMIVRRREMIDQRREMIDQRREMIDQIDQRRDRIDDRIDGGKRKRKRTQKKRKKSKKDKKGKKSKKYKKRKSKRTRKHSK